MINVQLIDKQHFIAVMWSLIQNTNSHWPKLHNSEGLSELITQQIIIYSKVKNIYDQYDDRYTPLWVESRIHPLYPCMLYEATKRVP